MRTVFLNWQVNNTFGWGILGYNLFCQWANDPELRPVPGYDVRDADIAMTDPFRRGRLEKTLREANAYGHSLPRDEKGHVLVNGVVIDALGNDLSPSVVYGTDNIGRCVFEDTRLEGAADKLKKYDRLLTASNWNAGLIEERTRRRPEVIFEGVDTSLFCPGPRSGVGDTDAFYVFSGGKIEYRKGQDLVLLAFRIFSAAHPDARLVTAWHSPWPKLAVGFRGRLERPLQAKPDGTLDILRWVSENGVDPGKVVEIPRTPNPLMPGVLREMDVALQPSRAEACTNLPVKEAMACGVPVIAGLNTGMKDILTRENSIPLTEQGPVDLQDQGTEGWGESSVDEIVAALEYAYKNRDAAKRLGRCASEWIAANGRTWADHAKALKRFVLAA